MKCSKMNNGSSSNKKGEKVMKTIESVEGCIVHRESSPKPCDNGVPYHRYCTSQASDHRSAPKAHLPPRKDISNESSDDHKKKDHHANAPKEFSWGCVAPIVETSKDVDINYEKKHTCSIGMYISKEPTPLNVSHNVLHT
jgi:hypothetical protein